MERRGISEGRSAGFSVETHFPLTKRKNFLIDMESNQRLLAQMVPFIIKIHYGFIVGSLLLLLSCTTPSSEQYWIKQHQQCVTQQNRLKKTSKAVEEYCQQWNSPLQRAQWLENNQGDPILIVENYLKHLKRFPDSETAKVLLAKARVNFIDQLVREMDLAIEQKNSAQIWKLAKDFQHIENLLKDYAPVPEMLSRYIRNTPEINQALQTIDTEINKDFEQNEKAEALKSAGEKGRFSRGFRAVLVVFCQNDTFVCEERYRTYRGLDE